MELLALLAVGGVAVWYAGYLLGNKHGHEEQHEQEMNFLCAEEKVEFELVNKIGDTWMVTSIMQRRGKRSV